MSTPPVEAILERRVFVHYPTGGVILEHVLVEGEWPDGLDRFQTSVTYRRQLPDERILQKQAHVGVPAATIEEAFGMLPVIQDRAGRVLHEEVEKELGPKLVVPIPNGRMRQHFGRMG